MIGNRRQRAHSENGLAYMMPSTTLLSKIRRDLKKDGNLLVMVAATKLSSRYLTWLLSCSKPARLPELRRTSTPRRWDVDRKGQSTERSNPAIPSLGTNCRRHTRAQIITATPSASRLSKSRARSDSGQQYEYPWRSHCLAPHCPHSANGLAAQEHGIRESQH